MTNVNSERWLLPEGTEEVLPEHAWQMELRRRAVLDLLRVWGYELVRPPLAEFRDALLTGIGAELANETVTVTDPLSGRLMGIRADMTPQVARIEAHYLQDKGISRLCYAGPTLFTRPGIRASREPLQCGAELFGSASPSADSEIIQLMVATVRALGLTEVYLDVGHMGLFSALVAPLALTSGVQTNLIGALQRKSREDLVAIAGDAGLTSSHTESIEALLNFSGGIEVIEGAREFYRAAPSAVNQALDNLAAVVEQLPAQIAGAPINVDLSELRGYRYHTGVIFSLFTPGYGGPIARGGRYDNIGMGFGRSRPATGFSADLRALFAHSRAPGERLSGAICAPSVKDATQLDELMSQVRVLRENGESVILMMPEQSVADVAGQCNRQLVYSDRGWEVIALT